jgi:hypothetical protein
LRVLWVTLSCLIMAPGLAAEAPTGLLACRSIADSAARLACFDREIATLAPSAVETVPAAPHPSAPPDAQQYFGLGGSAIAVQEEAAGIRPAKVAKIEAHVIGLSLTANGRTVFTLDNSQVWQQLESDGEMLARLGSTATVSRGALGSYWLQIKAGRGCKVTRTR